ncbi:MAG: L-threonylcarbamoyladenylate synthase [Gammaproteobacteria bacterium]|jgi:tRNA threonylcarbamoyl adenosine modification protein (Sua5/YciO/YrdC/YwlC family)
MAAQLLTIHPDNPQHRLIKQVVDVLRDGGVIVYPTDSAYALGCHIGDKKAMERLRRIRDVGDKHDFTLVCRDLSEISLYAKVSNSHYRLLKALTPGPYTFLLKATREVPRRLQNPKRRTIGIRVPENNIAHLILDVLREPIMSSTLILPDADLPMSDPDEIFDHLKNNVDLVVDGGFCGIEPTTVLDLVDDEPVVVRQGKGDISQFMEQQSL